MDIKKTYLLAAVSISSCMNLIAGEYCCEEPQPVCCSQEYMYCDYPVSPQWQSNCACGVVISAELIYWTVRQDGMDYVISSDSVSEEGFFTVAREPDYTPRRNATIKELELEPILRIT